MRRTDYTDRVLERGDEGLTLDVTCAAFHWRSQRWRWSRSCPSAAQAPKPKRINRAIELLEAGQPIYYTGSHSGTGQVRAGKQDAQTYADYISYDMEHAPYDIKGLADYMRGLVAGGPTKSGHRTPAVIVNVPVNGIDEAAVRANAWMFSQVLATGVHGVLLTPRGHARRRQGVHRSRPLPDPQTRRG